jgi:hypothetical protein
MPSGDFIFTKEYLSWKARQSKKVLNLDNSYPSDEFGWASDSNIFQHFPIDYQELRLGTGQTYTIPLRIIYVGRSGNGRDAYPPRIKIHLAAAAYPIPIEAAMKLSKWKRRKLREQYENSGLSDKYFFNTAQWVHFEKDGMIELIDRQAQTIDVKVHIPKDLPFKVKPFIIRPVSEVIEPQPDPIEGMNIPECHIRPITK